MVRVGKLGYADIFITLCLYLGLFNPQTEGYCVAKLSVDILCFSYTILYGAMQYIANEQVQVTTRFAIPGFLLTQSFNGDDHVRYP